MSADGLRERIARALYECEYDGMVDAVLVEIGDVERQCKCETLHGSFTKRDDTTSDTYIDRENCPIHRGDVERELAQLREIVIACAKLNCAKPPSGKHYKDPVYCGTCTSCRARDVLSRSGQQEEPQQ